MTQLSLQREATRAPADGVSYIEEILRLDYSFDDEGNDLVLLVPASTTEPILLQEVTHVVRTAFAGGTPSIEVGDGSDPDAFIATADVTETSAGNIARSIMKTNAKSAGQYLTSSLNITVTLSASLSAGAGTVLARVFRMA